MEQQADIVVIDEVGPMELEGSGWSESLDSLQNVSVPVQLWSVRETLSGEVMKHWDIPSDHLLPIDTLELSQAAELIGRTIERNRNF